LSFKYTDTDVRNGQEYLYAVTAYDRGFIAHDPLRDSVLVTQNRFNFRSASLENFLSNSDRLPHIVRAIPSRPPAGITPGEVSITKIDTTKGNGQFDIQVIDNKLLTGDEYLILFHADMSGGVPKDLTFDLIDITLGDTLLKNSRQFIKLDPEAKFKTIPPRIDGLEWIIKSATFTRVDKDNIEWRGNCDYTVRAWFQGTQFHALADYEVLFVGEGQENAYKATGLGPDTTEVVYKIPFQVWNKVTSGENALVKRKAKVAVFSDLAPTGQWSSGDVFFLYENHLVGQSPVTLQRTINLAFDWRETSYYDSTLKRTVPANINWVQGDTLFLPVHNPFWEGDGFIVKTDKLYEVEELDQESLKNVRVVPNPYIARAEWEFNEFNRKIQFTNLPARCTIYIFNVAGELIQTLEHDSVYDGSKDWNLWTLNRQEVAPGLYIWVVKTPEGKKQSGKFTIIR
jgi:hypothetical protein